MISLMDAFSFSAAVYKRDAVFPAVIIQEIHDLLQICCTIFFRKCKLLHIFLIYQTDGCFYFRIHFFFPFAYRLFPNKSIFIGTGFQLRPINKNRFFGNLIHFSQTAYHLIKQIFPCLRQKSSTKSCNCTVIRCLLTSQEPHEVNISAAGCFNFS